MKIQINKIVLNKTKTYLAPCLKEYGEEFETKLSSVYKVGIGIGDLILIENGINYEQHIFILIDTKIANSHFKKFIKWIRNQDMFEDDYAYDNIMNGQFHMVILKLHESCYKPAQLLRKSQFSKMYTKEQIEKYFKDKPNVRGVLIKDNQYRITYTQKLNEIFGSTIKPDELEGEFEFPVIKNKEIFNSHLKKV